ncbi:GNAT family N-acetyltransferase [Streptosporangium subroseum]|uniref:GNAT family N-acetyltransferase n=1 Tax=Streptosporangium subroseum TaxID=106412 RepID=UPI0034217215
MKGRAVELTATGDVVAACDDDTMIVWAARGMGAGVRAWALGEAVAVASPDLNRRDRLTVRGPAPQVARLVGLVRPELDPSYRLLGDRALLGELAERVPRVRMLASFEWMDAARPPPPAKAPAAGGWLEGAEREVSALLAEASPSSWATPGVAGVRRWAGLRAEDGTLVATAADAWSCPQVGFVAGVATAPSHRGRGHGERLCRFVFEALVAGHGRVALMVETGNHQAISLYERLGLRLRPVAAAALDGA